MELWSQMKGKEAGKGAVLAAASVISEGNSC